MHMFGEPVQAYLPYVLAKHSITFAFVRVGWQFLKWHELVVVIS